MVNNPTGITGFDFIEFSSQQPEKLHELFLKLGFSRLKKHKSKKIDYYKQNDIHFLINSEPKSFAADFNAAHGPSASATGWRVKNAVEARKVAIERGATQAERSDYYKANSDALEAIQGVGQSLIYFVDFLNIYFPKTPSKNFSVSF